MEVENKSECVRYPSHFFTPLELVKVKDLLVQMAKFFFDPVNLKS